MSSVLYALYVTDTNVEILGLDIQVNAVATVLKAFLKLSFDKNSTTLPCYMSSVLYALYIRFQCRNIGPRHSSECYSNGPKGFSEVIFW